MNPLILGMLIGAGTGVAKSALVDAPEEKANRTLASSTQRYSPWTGLKADAVKRADPLGSALQGGVAGAQFGQGVQAHQEATDLQKKMGNYFAGQTAVRDPALGQSFWSQQSGAGGSPRWSLRDPSWGSL